MKIDFVPDNFSESYDETKFSKDILSGIGLTPTDARIRFMLAWFKAEGIKNDPADSTFNPLATTWKMPNSTFYNCLKKDSTGACLVGVQNYPDYNTGLQATIKTLNQSFYSNIRKFLESNSNSIPQTDPGLEKDFATWGTGYNLFKSVFASGYGIVSAGSPLVKGNFLDNIGSLGKIAAVTGLLLTLANAIDKHERA